MDEKQKSEILVGAKYGCGGAVGVIIALVAIPLILLGGCLILGVGAERIADAAKPIPLSTAKQHENVALIDGIGYESREDAMKASKGEHVDGKTHTFQHGDEVRVRGKGKDGQRRVECSDGSKWWLSGDVLCRPV